MSTFTAPYEAIERDAVAGASTTLVEHERFRLSILNVVFLVEAIILGVGAIFLVRELTFASVVNGFFLFASAVLVLCLELFHADVLTTTFPFWSWSGARGILLVWLSAIAMLGQPLVGWISFAVSLLVLALSVCKVPVPRAIILTSSSPPTNSA
jgi:hypothetical protein